MSSLLNLISRFRKFDNKYAKHGRNRKNDTILRNLQYINNEHIINLLPEQHELNWFEKQLVQMVQIVINIILTILWSSLISDHPFSPCALFQISIFFYAFFVCLRKGNIFLFLVYIPHAANVQIYVSRSWSRSHTLNYIFVVVVGSLYSLAAAGTFPLGGALVCPLFVSYVKNAQILSFCFVSKANKQPKPKPKQKQKKSKKKIICDGKK